jgi:hypothetical protein
MMGTILRIIRGRVRESRMRSSEAEGVVLWRLILSISIPIEKGLSISIPIDKS